MSSSAAMQVHFATCFVPDPVSDPHHTPTALAADSTSSASSKRVLLSMNHPAGLVSKRQQELLARGFNPTYVIQRAYIDQHHPALDAYIDQATVWN
jgi:hypothetical protein